MNNDSIHKLNEAQAKIFDTEFVKDDRWEMVRYNIDKHFPNGDFTFADLGGGNGLFSDRILEQYPKSNCVLLDNSEYLISRNSSNLRKRLICDSVINAPNYIHDIDIVFYNWLLHHLLGDNYSKTYQNIIEALQMAKRLLKTNQNSFVSVFEIMYDGLLFDNLPNHLIYHLTSSRALSTVMRKLGANTAGVGVFYLSHRKWVETIHRSGFKIINYTDDNPCYIPMAWRTFLHMGRIRDGLFWIS